RNESFIWQARTFITKGQMSKAAALIEILKNDPQFPSRLHASLHEVQAYWFYKQEVYDSAAYHLDLALDNANGKLELARWEFLIGQLYQRSGKHDQAKDYFEKAVQHTYDPVLDVYARLNAIRENKGQNAGEDYIQENIHKLEKMAKKEVYAGYQDIIYFAAAEMELERKDKPAAINFLVKATKYANPNSPTRDKAFILLGDMAMEDKKYKAAKSYYDSVNVSDFAIAENLKTLQDRKRALSKIVAAQNTIDRQDSLQRIAAMPEDERNAYVKKLVKSLRKQQGLQEEENAEGQNFSFNSSNNNAQSDLFGANPSGDWYFNNNSIKARGFSDFKSKWGNRPNVDNWQVSSLVARQKIPNAPGQGNQGVAGENVAAQQSNVNITSEALLANLPLTPAKMQKSQDSIESSLFILGRSYEDEIPDYPSAINSYDSLLVKFPSSKYFEESLFHLYYCYKRLGDEVNAKRILDMM
ncbi:MAG TPA: tetratricopeptide repeat protein, partial [Puia sp.]|nr:tetratricopeptide repeat protein [Puia sp.]